MLPAFLIALESILGKVKEVSAVGGGSINECYKLSSVHGYCFCKVNSASKFPGLFEKEKAGLELLASNNIITPAVIACFTETDLQVLILEWIEPGLPDISYWEHLGERLAELHRTHGNNFGLDHNNYMGSVPQNNQPYEKWTTFFTEQRIIPLLEKCKGQLSEKIFLRFESLFKKLPEIFPDEKSSLLHGDLWSGNLLCNKNKQPVFIDPAVYYGHASIDIGMTQLFGGFHYSFIDAYQSNFDTDPNFNEQCEISNLYPLLIHLFLFGGQYQCSIEAILRKYAM